MKLKTISYFDWKYNYIDRFPDSTYRLGQHFINCFFKARGQDAERFYPDYYNLWNEKDFDSAEKMIFSLINQYDWDMMNLQLINPELM